MELLARLLQQDLLCVVIGAALAVRTVAGDDVKGVDRAENVAQDGDFVALCAVRIAPSVIIFMMVQDDIPYLWPDI